MKKSQKRSKSRNPVRPIQNFSENMEAIRLAVYKIPLNTRKKERQTSLYFHIKKYYNFSLSVDFYQNA